MKKNKVKRIILLLVCTMITSVFIGCGNKSMQGENTKTGTGEMSGTITTLGSSALQPLVEQIGVNFTAKHPKVTISVQGGGSGAGCNQVVSGNVNIGNSDVKAEDKLKDKNLAKQLVDHKVCGIGFAMVVSKDVKVESLTKRQIQDIFTGKITNWKEIGGEDKKINVINRGKASGTRATFKSTIMDNQEEKEGIGTTQDSSGNVRAAMKQTDGSISYLASAYIGEAIKKEIKQLKIDGVALTKENIIGKKYPFWSYEHMYTKGEPTGAVKAFLDYMVSEENKALIEKLGYIPMSYFK